MLGRSGVSANKLPGATAIPPEETLGEVADYLSAMHELLAVLILIGMPS